MKKENEIWTLVTPVCHSVLFNIAKQKKVPATKIVMDIVYNKLPAKLKDDYTFGTTGARKIVIMLSDIEYKHIVDLAKWENVKPSKYLRMVIYTYLKQEEYIE